MEKQEFLRSGRGVLIKTVVVFVFLAFFANDTFASEISSDFYTVIPFIGVLLTIAFCPLFLPKLWEKFEFTILFSWIVVSIFLCSFSIGIVNTREIVFESLLKDYIPFICLISALYVISSGVSIKINKKMSTWDNIFFIAFGEILANLIGTTGASVVLLPPLLKANAHRKYCAHTVIFFIFLVSNIGGTLLPFGDPPLFLGFLHGVDFFWTLKHLWGVFIFVSICLLYFYYFIDMWFLKKEEKENKIVTYKEKIYQGEKRVEFTGGYNFISMVLAIAIIVFTETIPKNGTVEIFSCKLSYNYFFRNAGLLFLTFMSLFVRYLRGKTNVELQKKLSWGPILEVTKYFLAIFVTMAPVSLIIKDIPLLQKISSGGAFMSFWITGIFSAFLDNAPTYLVFFKVAGGNAEYLMHEGAKILVSISAASVFFGALTYIGNAPNFMVRSMAREYGVKMPQFLGYTGWAVILLLPVFLAMSLLFL